MSHSKSKVMPFQYSDVANLEEALEDWLGDNEDKIVILDKTQSQSFDPSKGKTVVTVLLWYRHKDEDETT
jgi:hypothetical protein